jgi:methylated-DNA-[protein]-cysteine S-methyltransferase
MDEGTAVLDTPMGAVGVSWRDDVLTRVDLEPVGATDVDAGLPLDVKEQLDAYFRDGFKSFDLRLELRGTPFQRRVWDALRSIPPGQTITYGELARRLGSSPRAVGGACRANPCPIVVPCHRVVGVSGLGGFAGDTSGRRLELKRWLLRHEGHKG